MEIGNKNVNEIVLQHKGVDMKFGCQIKPMPYVPRLDLEPITSETILFNDLQEIDSLIEMLEKFKHYCIEYIGIWNRKRG